MQTCVHMCITGAPIQLRHVDNPAVRGYARYPSIDFVQMYDFVWGCPVSLNGINTSLRINPGPYCWVNGTLPVRLLLQLASNACSSRGPVKYNQAGQP